MPPHGKNTNRNKKVKRQSNRGDNDGASNTTTAEADEYAIYDNCHIKMYKEWQNKFETVTDPRIDRQIDKCLSV